MNSGRSSVADTANRTVVVIERQVALGGNKDTDIASCVQDDLNLGGAMLVLNDREDSTLTSRNGGKKRRGRSANRIVGVSKRDKKRGGYGYCGHDY